MIAEPEAATQIEERLRRLVQDDHRVIADHVTNAVRVAKLHGAQPIADARDDHRTMSDVLDAFEPERGLVGSHVRREPHVTQTLSFAAAPINVASCYELSGAPAPTSFDDMQRR